MKLPRIKISNNTKNRKIQNIFGFFFALEAVILLVLSLLGYI